MKFLGRLRLRTKLALLLIVFGLASVALTVVAASLLHQRMLADREDKLRALVVTVRGFAETLQHQVQIGALTQEQAIAELRDQLHHVRYGTKDDYFFAQTYDGMVVIHGGSSKREGKLTTARDAQGRTSAELANAALAHASVAEISYDVAKPGQKVKTPKISFVARFAPWKLDFMTGSWTDDVDAAYYSALKRLLTYAGGLLLLGLVFVWLINHDISGSLGRLRLAMTRLADGDLGAEIPGLGRKDEVGAMAAAMQVFKSNASEIERLTATQEQEEQRRRGERLREMAQFADQFDAQVTGVVEAVASAATELQAMASSMTDTAGQTGHRASAVASASEEASTNVQAIAAAAEQLSSSVGEISRQVASSSEIAAKASAESERSNSLVNSLSEAARQIGAVTNIINEIASKTNLLALNATIEAARAGEAGKGFAVVASEVKSLATQTAKATQEISGQIAAIQGATDQTVTAIQSIGTTIGQMREIATVIAAAVEEQGAATQEIARNIQHAAACTTDVSQNITGVTDSIGATSSAATQVFGAAHDLSQHSETLRGQVDDFLRAVRAA